MTSPFKFLDPYDRDDSKTFFGRDVEVDQLYTLVVQSRLVLVYGPSGSGKTSIIQCGLANRFNATDWFPVFVRRKDDINASLDLEIHAQAETPIDPGADIVASTQSLYRDYYRPIYFIFDQFEELFILGNEAEEEKFFASIKALLASDLNCKVIISMREEYIALLQSFERAVPTLFDKRLRIEQMTLGTVEEVIVGMTAAAGIGLENGAETARRIIAQIGDRRAGVQLAYLQVYLDKLHREAEKSATPGLFTDALVDKTGALGDVMADFLEEQTKAIEAVVCQRHPKLAPGSVQRVLETLTTVEGTKQPISGSELAERLPDLEPMLGDILIALENSRIIRRADDIIEVSHDSLARRIAERRSGDRKALMRVEKMIKDRLASYEQTKTYLVSEELAVAKPVLSQLELTPAEAGFVDRSRKKLWWRRASAVGVIVGVIVSLLGLTAWAITGQDEARYQTAQAQWVTNSMGLAILEEMAKLPNAESVQKRLFENLSDSGDPGITQYWAYMLDGKSAERQFEAEAIARSGKQQDPDDRETIKALFDVAKQNYDYAIEVAANPDVYATDSASKDAIFYNGVSYWKTNEALARRKLGLLALKQYSVSNNPQMMKISAKELSEAVNLSKLEAEYGKDFDTQYYYAGSLYDLGRALKIFGKSDEAGKQIGTALNILRQLEKSDPKFTKKDDESVKSDSEFRDLNITIARTQAFLADIDLKKGKIDSANARLVDARDRLIKISLVEDYTEYAPIQVELWTSALIRAKLAFAQGRKAEASAALAEAEIVYQSLVVDDNIELSQIRDEAFALRDSIDRMPDIAAGRVATTAAPKAPGKKP